MNITLFHHLDMTSLVLMMVSLLYIMIDMICVLFLFILFVLGFAYDYYLACTHRHTLCLCREKNCVSRSQKILRTYTTSFIIIVPWSLDCSRDTLEQVLVKSLQIKVHDEISATWQGKKLVSYPNLS